MIAILGAGGVGGLLAGALARSGTEVELITREESAAAIARLGLQVDSPRFGSFHTWVRAVDRLREPVDVLVVAVKAPHLEDALDRIAAEPGTVVPLLNGFEHLAPLRERFGDRVVAGVIRVQAHREGFAHVVHRAPFVSVTLAQPGHPPLEAALEQAGVDVERGGTDADVLWGKLSRLAGLALATAAHDAPLGAVRDDAERAAREVAAVAVAEGAAIDAETVVKELALLPDEASSSLRADLASGGASELDAIAGAVLRAAARHGVDARTVEHLAATIAAR